MAALLLFMTGLTAFAFYQRREADQQSRLAQAKSLEAMEQELKANHNAMLAAESESKAQESLVAAQHARESEEKQKVLAVQTAKDNKALAVKNGELAHRAETEAKRAKEQTALAIKNKDKAEGALNRLAAALNELSVAVSPNSKFIVTACNDKASDSNGVKTWDAGTGNLINVVDTVADNIPGVHSVAFSPDSQFIVITARNKSAAAIYRVWGNPKSVLLLGGDYYIFKDAVYSQNGENIITVDDGAGAARVWKASGGEPVHPLRTLPLSSSARLSPQGIYLFEEYSNALHVLDVKTGDEVSLIPYAGPLTSIALSSDEKYMILVGGKTAQVWDVSTGKRLATLGGDEPTPSPAASPTTTASAETRCETQGHQAPLSSAAFSPDGKYIVTASADKTALVWDWKAGK